MDEENILIGFQQDEIYINSNFQMPGYMLPLSFKQGNIIYFFTNSELNLEVFYNRIENKIKFNS